MAEDLYAIGNDAASIMGGNYPGADTTLGPAHHFAYVCGIQLARAATTAGSTLQIDRREAAMTGQRA